MTTSYDFDCAVIGGGPGGSAAAISLSRLGHKVALIESDKFPRFHIGESLLPKSNEVFKKLGIYDEIKHQNYPEKWGAIFYDEAGSKEVIFDFGHSPVLGNAPTYHVPRADFDHLILRHAEKAGAKMLAGRVQDLQFDPDGVSIEWSPSQGVTEKIRAKAIIDATGRAGLMAKRLSYREQDPTLQKAAIYGHFKNVPRPEGRHAGSIRIVSTRDLKWVWLIPLPNDVMSVGVVMDLDQFKRLEKNAAEENLMKLLRNIPATARITQDAKLISGVHMESSFSYGTKSYVGDRWIMVGDAGSFLDPVFSSGVMFALYAGVEAADMLHSGFQSNNFSAEKFAPYDRSQQKRYRFFRRFVRGFYKPHFRDLFYHPSTKFGLKQAVTTVLGGAWNLSLADRVRIGTFFQLVNLQKRFDLSPRLHGSN